VNYELVYDIRNAGYIGWGVTATALIAILTGIVVMVARKSLDRRGATIFTYLILGIVGIWTAAAWISMHREYSIAASALEIGSAPVVQGHVSKFEPMPYVGHSKERFCVEDRCFSYSDFDPTVGFNNTTSHGGPIKAGIPVRVTFVGNTIVKLEVGQ